MIREQFEPDHEKSGKEAEEDILATAEEDQVDLRRARPLKSLTT
jgi:hypothetical protein